jgi:hypothetical protein
MSDLDDFLAETHPRLIAELQALHNGDPNPQLQALPISTVARTASGRSPTATPTTPRSIRAHQVRAAGRQE